MDFVGYRNLKLVEQLTKQGRVTKTFKGKRTFDSDQFALLHMMASATYDWPLDDKTQGLGKMPRIYAYGWLEMARALGMTLPDGIDEIEVIGNEPRAPKLENAAYQRISKAAKKLHGAFHIIAETTIILADPLDGLGTVSPIITLHRRNPSPCRRQVRKVCFPSPRRLSTEPRHANEVPARVRSMPHNGG